MAKRLAIVDHFDSFVHTIAGYCRALGVEHQLIRHNDASLANLREFDAILLSPGPGHPNEAVNSLAAVTEFSRTPILGICLGHQVLGAAYGAAIVRSAPVHGRTSRVHHVAERAFQGLPSPTLLARYHSLVVAEVSAELCVDAWTDDEIVMAVSHARRPHWGLQPHPEAISSRLGGRVLANFLAFAGFSVSEAGLLRLLTEPNRSRETAVEGGPILAEPGVGGNFSGEPSDFFAEPIQSVYPLPGPQKPR